MMNWKSPAEWEKLKKGHDCPFCADIWTDKNAYGFKAIELDTTIVRIPWNQHYKGWTIVALKKHATELFDLSNTELLKFWEEVSLTAKALYEIFNATKINYNVWGSHIPHIHCHLFVMTYNDDPSKPLNPHEKEVLLSDSEYFDFKNKLIYSMTKVKN